MTLSLTCKINCLPDILHSVNNGQEWDFNSNFCLFTECPRYHEQKKAVTQYGSFVILGKVYREYMVYIKTSQKFFLFELKNVGTVCPGSSDPFYIVTYYLK